MIQILDNGITVGWFLFSIIIEFALLSQTWVNHIEDLWYWVGMLESWLSHRQKFIQEMDLKENPIYSNIQISPKISIRRRRRLFNIFTQILNLFLRVNQRGQVEVKENSKLGTVWPSRVDDFINNWSSIILIFITIP